MKSGQKQTGFTIVELLIVVVVIAILAAITIVSYNGITTNARDSQRKNDIATITKALEMYYVDNGRFPASSGSSTINTSWSTTADTSWQTLKNQLVPKYISALPVEPQNISGNDPLGGQGRGYSYFVTETNTYCGVGAGQMYILVYRLGATTQKDTLIGDCTSGNQLYYPGNSNYRVVK